MTLTIASTSTTFSVAKSELGMPRPERRKNRRFALSHPTTVRYKGELSHEFEAFTLNASIDGVLLTAEHLIPDGWAAHVTIRLQKDGLETVRLHGVGRVARTELRPTGRYGIAITFDKPMTAA